MSSAGKGASLVERLVLMMLGGRSAGDHGRSDCYEGELHCGVVYNINRFVFCLLSVYS